MKLGKFAWSLLAMAVVLFVALKLAEEHPSLGRAVAIVVLLLALLLGYASTRSTYKKTPSPRGNSLPWYVFLSLLFLGVVASVQFCRDAYLMLTQGVRAYLVVGLGIRWAVATILFIVAARFRRRANSP